jgi:peptide/nickel transport system ATP-binding protein
VTALLRIEELVVQARTPTGAVITIVDNVSLEIRPREVVALIGESGAGKTTVALSALGYARPGTRIIGGRVFLGDVDVLGLTPRQRRELRGKDVAYVAQSAQASLNPAIPIGEQVGEGLVIHGIARGEEAKRRSTELLTTLDLPDPPALVERYPHQASGGQQQRIMMAMAMSCGPSLLVLDEPTTALDVTTQIEVLKAIKDAIQERHTAAIYVSHDLAVVAQVADRILVMNGGRVVEEGPTSEILNNPQDDYTKLLLSAVRPPPNASAKPAAQPVATTDEGAADGALLSVKSLCATYERPRLFGAIERDQQVLQDVDLEVRPREVLAVVGESGCGKSTLARVIAGLHPALEGEMAFAGEVLRDRVSKRPLEVLRKIQIVFQSPDLSLNPEHLVEKSLGRPLELYFDMTAAERRDRVDELLESVGLDLDFAGRYPGELSGGERQRLSLARAFAAEPELVLCDEVLSSLDTVVAASVLELMRRLREKFKVAYMFISHDLSTVATIADRVAVLYAGRVVDVGPTDRVFAAPHHPYTSLLIASVPALHQGWLEATLESHAAKGGGAFAGVMPRDAACPFRTRCPLMMPGVCDREPPPERQAGGGHVIHCHRDIDELAAAQRPIDGHA